MKHIYFAAEGRLSCVDSTTYNQENDVQILVYNLDETVDNLNTFRFSCIVSIFNEFNRNSDPALHINV